MTISRERALKALDLAKQDPTAFSDQEIDELLDIAAPKGAPAAESNSMFNLGPTGGDMLADKIPVPPSPDEEILKLAEKPGAMQAMKLSPKMTVGQPGETEEMAVQRRDQERQAYDASHFGDDAPEASQTASRRKDLHAPPEFRPPSQEPPTMPGGGVNPMEMFSGALGKAKEAIHMTEYFLEPPVTQFRREMAPYIPGVADMGIGDDAYKEYADQLWKTIHDQAKAEGRPVVRVAYKKAETGGDVVKKALVENVAGPLMGAVSGVNRQAFGLPAKAIGALDKETGENVGRMGETYPLSELAGEVVGGASRVSPMGLASQAITKSLPAAGARTLLGAGGRGALAGAGAGAVGATSIAASEDRLPTGMELFLGGGLGAIPGAAQGAHKKALLRSMPALSKAEIGGVAETDILRGVKRTPKGQAIQEASEEAFGGQTGREQDFVAGKMEQPLTQGARRLAATTQRDVGVPQRTYYDMSADVRKPQTAIVKEAMKLHERGAYESGSNLPRHAQQNKDLQKLIGDAAHMEIAPSVNDQAITKSARPGSFDLTPEAAAKQGIDVERVMSRYRDAAHMAPGEYMIRVTPKELNAEQTENIIQKLHAQIGEGKDVDALKSLHRASREVRDQFPAMGPINANETASIDLGAGETLELKGWSAWQHKAAEKTQGSKRTLEMGGFSGDVPTRLGGNEAKGQFGATKNYMAEGQHPDADAALRELAQLGNATPGMLEAVAGEAGMKSLPGGVPTSRAGILQGARLRLDPLLQFYGPAFASAAPGAPDKVTGKQKLSHPLDEETLRQLRSITGRFGP